MTPVLTLSPPEVLAPVLMWVLLLRAGLALAPQAIRMSLMVGLVVKLVSIPMVVLVSTVLVDHVKTCKLLALAIPAIVPLITTIILMVLLVYLVRMTNALGILVVMVSAPMYLPRELAGPVSVIQIMRNTKANVCM
jgi:hypothetical protein